MSVCNVGDLGLIPGWGRFPGEGNGNPLQYSCLENPKDGEAWWPTVHGAAKSRVRLSNFTYFSFFLIQYDWCLGKKWRRQTDTHMETISWRQRQGLKCCSHKPRTPEGGRDKEEPSQRDFRGRMALPTFNFRLEPPELRGDKSVLFKPPSCGSLLWQLSKLAPRGLWDWRRKSFQSLRGGPSGGEDSDVRQTLEAASLTRHFISQLGHQRSGELLP